MGDGGCVRFVVACSHELFGRLISRDDELFIYFKNHELENDTCLRLTGLGKLNNKKMDMIKDYDKRQLELMKERILLFRKGSIPLQILINDVGSLLDVLEDIESNWKDECRSSWWDLEQVYAVALDRGKTDLDENDTEFISEVLKKLEAYVNQILN